MSKQEPPRGTKAVRRAIALLKAVASQNRGAKLHELGEALDLAPTTTHRLVGALECEGLVSRDEDTNAYRLGPAAVALGARALRTYDLRAAARSALELLAHESGETSTLEVLDDAGRMLILDEVPGRHLVAVAQEVGTVWPVHATATGRALLSRLPRERVLAVLDERLEAFTESTIVDRDELLEELERVRAAGYAVNFEELAEGVGAVAAAVMGPRGDALASISIGGPLTRITRSRLEDLGERVAEEAARVSASLGYGEDD